MKLKICNVPLTSSYISCQILRGTHKSVISLLLCKFSHVMQKDSRRKAL